MWVHKIHDLVNKNPSEFNKQVNSHLKMFKYINENKNHCCNGFTSVVKYRYEGFHRYFAAIPDSMIAQTTPSNNQWYETTDTWGRKSKDNNIVLN